MAEDFRDSDEFEMDEIDVNLEEIFEKIRQKSNIKKNIKEIKISMKFYNE